MIKLTNNQVVLIFLNKYYMWPTKFQCSAYKFYISFPELNFKNFFYFFKIGNLRTAVFYEGSYF